MAHQLWVHAIRLAPDAIAFQKWEEFMTVCDDGDEATNIDKEGFKTWKSISKEADKLKSAYRKLLDKMEIEMEWVLSDQWITKKAP